MTTLPPPTRGSAFIHGTRLPYELQGVGFPVVLLPGSLRLWDTVAGALAWHFTVLRLAPEGESSEDLRALLDSLSMDRVHVVGHSLGGRVALDFARAHPERVSCLALVGPGLPPSLATRLQQLRVPTRLLMKEEALPEDFTRALLDFLQEQVPLHPGAPPPA